MRGHVNHWADFEQLRIEEISVSIALFGYIPSVDGTPGMGVSLFF